MSLRLLHALVILFAIGSLFELPASANSGFGTPAEFVFEAEPKDVSIDVFYVVRRPRSHPDALFLFEFRRSDDGEWKRSMGRAILEFREGGSKMLRVNWTSGVLEGETAMLEILSANSARWHDGKTEKQIPFEKPPFGQKFDVTTVRLPEAISSQLLSMQTTSLQHAFLHSEKY